METLRIISSAITRAHGSEMFKDKHVFLDDKLYQVTFAGDRCYGVRVNIESRWKAREHWRTVWNMGQQSERVQTIIAAAREA
jgi:hypothetical protein